MNNAQKHYLKERLCRKVTEVENLAALVATWEPHESRDDETMAYVAGLRRRHRIAQTQLVNMGGDLC